MQSESSSPRRDAPTDPRYRDGGEILTPAPDFDPAKEPLPEQTSARSSDRAHPLGRGPVRGFVAGASALVCAAALAVCTVLPASNAMTSVAVTETGESQLMLTGSTAGGPAGGPGAGLSETLPLVQTAPKLAATASAAVSIAGLEDTKLRYPFDSKVAHTDGFGYRSAPVAGFHDAQDLAPAAGTPIRIIGDGVVSEAGFESDGCGFGLKVEHKVAGQSVSSRYCHMESDSHDFEVGDTVEMSDVAGRVGATGMAFGAHLHLVIKLEGEAIDPLPFIELHSE